MWPSWLSRHNDLTFDQRVEMVLSGQASEMPYGDDYVIKPIEGGYGLSPVTTIGSLKSAARYFKDVKRHHRTRRARLSVRVDILPDFNEQARRRRRRLQPLPHKQAYRQFRSVRALHRWSNSRKGRAALMNAIVHWGLQVKVK